ncbi:hypothetical protein JL720_876 [Aureococcus anophagefferens]|nr:hypothetical protein JL720_876 [Aureococcus anophagefferens]
MAAMDFACVMPPYLERTVADWLRDDCPSLDVGGLVVGDGVTTATLWCKSSGVLAGKPFFDATFAALGDCVVTWLVDEGAAIDCAGGKMVMLKDNHVWAAGSITTAVTTAKRAAGFSAKIEVECRDLGEALEAAAAGADVVMLDNFDPADLKVAAKAVKAAHPHVLVEASGGITLDTMASYLSPDVDVVSQGALTQGYACVDFSLKLPKPEGLTCNAQFGPARRPALSRRGSALRPSTLPQSPQHY